MFPYIFIFLIIASLMFLSYGIKLDQKASSLLKVFVFFVLAIFIGLRHEVGGDWSSYLWWFENVKSSGLSLSLESVFLSDIGYNFFNWISANLGLDIYGVNTMCAFVFLIGLFYFLNYLGDDRDFYLGLMISYPYLIMVVANGYTRQSVAVGLVLMTYAQILRGKKASTFLTQLIAFLFHKSSLIGFVVFFFRRFSFKLLALLSSVALVFYAYFERLFMRFYNLYVKGAMISEGGSLRALMNMLPALIFIVLYSSFKKRYVNDSGFWLFFSYMALVLSFLSLFKFTFADRLLLYFSAIQPLVFVRLKHVLPQLEMKGLVLTGVFFVYSLAMLVWLLFAVHSASWIPYDNVILRLFK